MYKKISKYFFSGLLTALPLIIIYQIIKSFAGIFREFFPELNIFLSFIFSLLLMVLLGFLVNTFLSKKIRRKLHNKSKESGIIAGFSKIILNIKILSEKTKNVFKNPVLYKVNDGIYKLGYISNTSFTFLENTKAGSFNEAIPEKDAVWVFSPSPINFSGSLQLVEMRKIKKIENANKEDISFFILTAGVNKSIQEEINNT